MAESFRTLKRARFDATDITTVQETPTAMPLAAMPVGTSVSAMPNVQEKPFPFEVELRPESIFDGLKNVQNTRLQPGSSEFNEIVAPMNATPGFYSIAVFSVENSDVSAHFGIQSASIAKQNGGNANIITGYHCASTNAIRAILDSGFNIALSRIGFFGKGAYFTKSVLKANNYSPKKGNPNSIRLMLICDVVLGLNKEFKLGHLDRQLVQAPKGSHSVRGFLTRDYEYVVYNQNQIRPRYLVFYNFTNTALEMETPTNIPSGVKGKVVFITASLIEFFGMLQQNSKPEQQHMIKYLITELLEKTINVKQFLQHISNLLNAAPPTDLESKLNAELEKCKPAKPQTTGIPTTATDRGVYSAPTSVVKVSLAQASSSPIEPSAPTSVFSAASKLILTPSVEAASVLISIRCSSANAACACASASAASSMVITKDDEYIENDANQKARPE